MDSAANELRQIKLQDQIRDLKEIEYRLSRSRRRDIFDLIRFSLLVVMAMLILQLPFGLQLLAGKLDFASLKFSPLFFGSIGLLLLLDGLLIYRIRDKSRKLADIDQDIKQRFGELHQLKRKQG